MLAATQPSSAGTQIVNAFNSVATGLAHFQPRVAAINLGLTVVIVQADRAALADRGGHG